MRLNVEVVHCGEDLNMMRPAIPWAGDFLACLTVGKKEEAPQKFLFSCFGARRKRGDLQVGGSKSAQTQAASEQGGQLSIIQKTCSATLNNAYAFTQQVTCNMHNDTLVVQHSFSESVKVII